MNETSTGSNHANTSSGYDRGFSDWIDSIMNSRVLKKIKEFINSFISNFGLAGTKEKVDSYINSVDREKNDTIFNGIYQRVSKFVEKKFGKRIRSQKLLYWISKIICIILTAAFGALVIYMMIKLLPKIIMMIAAVFATTISIEIIIAILNRTFSQATNA